MDPKLHIIISSEQGHAKTFVISKPVLKKILTSISLVFVVSTVAGISYSIENFNLKDKIDNLENNVSTLSTEKKDLKHHVTSLEKKTKAQYGELNQRSQVIDSIFNVLDIASPSPSADLEKPGQNQGGPFTKLLDESLENLIHKVDRDIQTIQPIPLGYPVNARRVTSKFGKRVDPINGQGGFHDGIDFSGKRGSEIRATADGKVAARGRNDTYGWYVRIDHGNGFTTMYAHNEKILVRWGTEVKRGEAIALLGNTGRSTGPHLHYEVRYKNRPIDPAKFININKLVSVNNA
ncbi:MAG: M23 family metallopeptidase [Thermodesulfobacteriota bacterium]